MIHSLSGDGVRAFKDKPFESALPSSTQFLKRMIHTVSKLGMVAADPKIQDGFIKATRHSEKILPQ